MTKWDKILIGLIIIISLASIIGITYYKNQVEALYGIIEVNGEETKRIDLSKVNEPYEIRIKNKKEFNILKVEKNRMGFVEASCPDKDCIKIGWLEAPGETSVCLPNNVVARIEGTKGSKDEIDSTTY